MKRLIFFTICAVTVLASFAKAQQPPPYVPMVIDEKSYSELRGFLLEQPAKMAIPVLQWLEQQQNAARMAKMKEEAAKAKIAAGPPDPPKK
jgi:nitrous oxide reductase accessory protein NosL